MCGALLVYFILYSSNKVKLSCKIRDEYGLVKDQVDHLKKQNNTGDMKQNYPGDWQGSIYILSDYVKAIDVSW